MKTLNQSWREYREAVYPVALPADQNAQLHQAFFAAAFVCLHEHVDEISRLPDADALTYLKKLRDEAHAVCVLRTGIKSHN